uniref:Uncharacterized protein n=1 Tax=Rhizophora mucronata TaxID=61149 RepID=A0A2P2NRT5_RHIMU
MKRQTNKDDQIQSNTMPAWHMSLKITQVPAKLHSQILYKSTSNAVRCARVIQK